MKELPLPTNLSPALAGLLDRCQTLGLPAWCWTADRQLLSQPLGWGPADAWLNSSVFIGELERLCARWSTTDVSANALVPTELIPGCWVIPLRSAHFDDEGAIITVVALGPAVLHAAMFGSICSEDGLLRVRVRQALAPLARHHDHQIAGIHQMLDWMVTDLAQQQNDEHAIASFSTQLVDAYEQMNLLYSVADAMSGLEDTTAFVKMACGLLLDTLDFDWFTVRFAALPQLGRGLANELIVMGTISCSHTRYDRLAGELVMSIDAETPPTVLGLEDSALSKFVGSEIFMNPLICNNNLAGILLAGSKQGKDPDVSSVDMQLISATADYLSAFLHNSALYNEQRTMFLGVVNALSASIDAKDPYTRGHSERVAHLSSQLAVAVGMTDDQASRVRLAGILHDIGKIGVPETVLLKPGRLTDEEFAAVRRHPTIGYNILKDIEPLTDVLPGVLYHHERWDGKGYPHGLKGGNIPLMGRLLAVADAFDAMSSDRAYRPRISREKVMTEMRSGAGTQWDAELIRVFMTLDLAKYDAMIDRHAAQATQAA